EKFFVSIAFFLRHSVWVSVQLHPSLSVDCLDFLEETGTAECLTKSEQKQRLTKSLTTVRTNRREVAIVPPIPKSTFCKKLNFEFQRIEIHSRRCGVEFSNGIVVVFGHLTTDRFQLNSKIEGQFHRK